MKNIIICEKPSVAKTIASYLGAHLGTFSKHTNKGVGYLENDQWVITWCFGHLVTLCYPEDYDEAMKTWSLDTLPFLPNEYKYRTITNTREQFDIIKNIYHRSDIDTLYYCPDPAREGVLIQYLVRKLAGLNSNITEKMMWIDSITESEVLRALKEAKPVSNYDNIRDAGLARSIEDYALGINFSRALSKRFEKTIGGQQPVVVGRVMTCVLGMVVEREREIENFVPTDFYKINTKLNGTDVVLGWKATKTNPIYNKIEPYLYNESGFKNRSLAANFMNGLGSNQIVESKEIKTEKRNAPLLFNLAELQATCSRLFKISPAKTLEIIQNLYEKKLLTYPRTDARVLSEAIADEIDKNLRMITHLSNKELSDAASYILSKELYKGIKNTRYVDDSKIEDHYAIIPANESITALSSCDELEQKVFELIVRRFLSIFLPAAEYEKTSIVTKDDKRGERFYLSGSVLIEPGYLKVAGIPQSKDSLPNELKSIKKGDKYSCTYEIIDGKTQPPKHYTTGSIILAMENAGNLIEDESLREQIKGSGIGTSATRAATLDKLVNNKYLNLATKTQVLSVAPYGDVVYEIVKSTIPDLLNPKMTAEWERGLSLIANGSMSQSKYLQKLNEYITHYVDVIKKTKPNSVVEQVSKKIPKTKKTAGPKKDNIQTYLDVPFEDKDKVKTLGAWFDATKKAWYVPKNGDISKFQKWLPNGKVTKTMATPQKIWLKVPYDNKDEAKNLGARWDSDKKQWYVLSTNPNIETLKQWR